MAGAIRICSHNIDGFGSCDIMADGVCVQGPCHAEELVEYAPMVHGEWRYFRESFSVRPHFRCSSCLRPRYEHYACNEFRFCPNCGAKMDGGDPDGR